MGCDIHLFLERKRSTDKEWHLDAKHTVHIEGSGTKHEYRYTAELCSSRSYEFFGELAGVRYSGSGATPRGIPKNASEGFLAACEYGDGHSHSYASIERYTKVADKCTFGKDVNVATMKHRDPFTEQYSLPNPFHIVLAYIHDIKESNAINHMLTDDPFYLDEKFRLMFFFDS